MAGEAAQLGQLPNLNLSGYIPVHEKPQIWQRALAQFLGGTASDVAGTELKSAMSPNVGTNPDGTVSFAANQPWYKTSPSADQELSAAATNANIKHTGAETARTNTLTPAELQQMMASTGRSNAETQNVLTMTPAQKAQMDAQTKNLVSSGNWIAPKAQSDIGLQGAQTQNLQTNTALAPSLAASTMGQQGAGANYTNQLAQFVGPQAQSNMAEQAARTKLLGGQTGMTNQDVMQKQLMFQNMLKYFNTPGNGTGMPMSLPQNTGSSGLIPAGQ